MWVEKKKWRICDWWSDYANASPLLPEIFLENFLQTTIYYYYYYNYTTTTFYSIGAYYKYCPSLPIQSIWFPYFPSYRNAKRWTSSLQIEIFKKETNQWWKYDKIILYNYNSTEHYVCYYTNMLYYKEIRRFKVNILTEDYYVLRNHEATSSPN